MPGDALAARRERKAAHSRRHRRGLKAAALAAYGGPRCSCPGCGETIQEFLALDHVNGGGSEHRRFDTKGGGSKLYQWVKTNGYPAGFRVLCHNCNLGRHVNGGVCPHVDRDRNPGGGDNPGPVAGEGGLEVADIGPGQTVRLLDGLGPLGDGLPLVAPAPPEGRGVG